LFFPPKALLVFLANPARMVTLVPLVRTATPAVQAQLVPLANPARMATLALPAKTVIPVVQDLRVKLDSLATLVICCTIFIGIF